MPKVEKEPQRTLDVIEAWTTINACDPSSIKGIRDRALISLMVDSGLRASEVCRLCVDDLVFGVQLFDPLSGTLIEVNQIIAVRKRGKKGDAYFGPETADWVRAWLKVRDSVVKHSGIKELFVSLGGIKPGTKLTRDGLRVIVRKLAQQAGVDHFSPHALRRSFACFLNEAGASSRNIQLFGGWSNIREVETYTQAIMVGRQYARYNPVGFLSKIAQQGSITHNNSNFD